MREYGVHLLLILSTFLLVSLITYGNIIEVLILGFVCGLLSGLYLEGQIVVLKLCGVVATRKIEIMFAVIIFITMIFVIVMVARSVIEKQEILGIITSVIY